MSSKKPSPEEELEKQYRDYKAQFETWKRKNAGSENTDGYRKYVQQFEQWEKDVEIRRQVVRNKTQQERQRQDAVSNEQRQRQEEAAAMRYAKQQESYLSIHQRALEEQDRLRKQQQQQRTGVVPSMSVGGAQVEHQVAQSTVSMGTPSHGSMQPMITGVSGVPNRSAKFGMDHKHPGTMMSQMHEATPLDTSTTAEEAIKRGPHIQADPQPIQAQQNSTVADQDTRPLLWGANGGEYLPTDPMYIKWRDHAQPPNLRDSYQPPPPNSVVTPSWYLQKKMEETDLFYGHSISLNATPELLLPPLDIPPPTIRPAPNFPPPPLIGVNNTPNGDSTSSLAAMDTSARNNMPPSTTIVVAGQQHTSQGNRAGVNVSITSVSNVRSVPPPPMDFSIPPPNLIAHVTQ